MTRTQWYLNRLRTMSPAETAHRALRLASARYEALAARLHTPAPPPAMSRPTQAFVRPCPAIDPEPYVEVADRILQGSVELLFKSVDGGLPPEWNRNPVTGERAPMTFGKTLDYRNRKLVGDIKYLWVLNRHHQTLRLAQAYALGHEQRHLDGIAGLLESWFEQCPYPLGPNWTSSLEQAIRLINWSAAWYLIGGDDSPLFEGERGCALKSRWLDSIHQHLAFIEGHFSRHSSANNHLLGEAAGLFIGASVWPCWPRSTAWRRRGRQILESELDRQVTGDGVDLEHSTFYQNFVLEFLLAAGLIARAQGDDLSPGYWRKVERMVEFLAAVTDSAGHVPAIGDSDDALILQLDPQRPAFVFHPTLALAAHLFGRPELTRPGLQPTDAVHWLSGVDGGSQPDGSRTLPNAFREAGYYVLGRGLGGPDEIRIVANATPLGYLSIAAHGHADALALTLSIAGEPLLIDPGTYAYQSEPAWRNYFRGTAAHNTVRVDGEDQAVIGGNFMWLTRYESTVTTWTSDDSADELVASHDGYARLADGVRHERRFRFDKATDVLTVTDRFECAGEHAIERFWHVAPEADVHVETGGVRAEGARARVTIHVAAADAVTLHRGEEDPILGWHSPRFGEKAPTTVLRVANTIRGPATLETRITIKPSGSS